MHRTPTRHCTKPWGGARRTVDRRFEEVWTSSPTRTGGALQVAPKGGLDEASTTPPSDPRGPLQGSLGCHFAALPLEAHWEGHSAITWRGPQVLLGPRGPQAPIRVCLEGHFAQVQLEDASEDTWRRPASAPPRAFPGCLKTHFRATWARPPGARARALPGSVGANLNAAWGRPRRQRGRQLESHLEPPFKAAWEPLHEGLGEHSKRP